MSVFDVVGGKWTDTCPRHEHVHVFDELEWGGAWRTRHAREGGARGVRSWDMCWPLSQLPTPALSTLTHS